MNTIRLNISEIEGLYCKIFAKGSTSSIELKDFVRNNPDVFEIIVDYRNTGNVKFRRNVLLIYDDVEYNSFEYSDCTYADELLTLVDFRIL